MSPTTDKLSFRHTRHSKPKALQPTYTFHFPMQFVHQPCPMQPPSSSSNLIVRDDDKVPNVTLDGIRTKRSMIGRWKACTPCRAKKTRCDGLQPTCGPCSGLERPCHYAEKKKPRNPPSRADLVAKYDDLQGKLRTMLRKSPNQGSPRSKTHPKKLTQQHTGSSSATSDGYPELSEEDRELILGIFFQYQHRTSSQIVKERFMDALRAVDPAQQPHPALVDTMVLIGILFANITSQSSLLPLNTPDYAVLLSRIHKSLEKSLGNADRILDYIQASIMLCTWYFYNGRLQEAQYVSSSTFRLAVNCQLHRIDGAVLQEALNETNSTSFWDGTILGRPRDRYDIYLRVAVFWQCYAYESVVSLVTGLPSACDESTTRCVTTVWPRPLADYESGAALSPEHLRSIKELLADNADDKTQPDDFIHPTRWKILVLLSRTAHTFSLSTILGKDDHDDCEELMETTHSLATSLQRFAASLPYSKVGQYEQNADELSYTTKCGTLFAQLGECAARIYLIRAAERLTKLKETDPDPTTDLTNLGQFDPYDIIAPLDLPECGSFLRTNFVVARSGIRLVHDVAVGHCHLEADGQSPASSSWLTHFPHTSGFMLTPPMLVVVEYIRDLEEQLKKAASDGSLPDQQVLLSLQDAEETYAQGLAVMNLLSDNLSLLKFQIQKIEESRSAP